MVFVPYPLALEYAAKDADALCRCWEKVDKILERDGLKNYFWDPMMRLSKNLLWSGIIGVPVDREQVERVSGELQDLMEELTGRVEEQLKHPINLNSPQQKVKALFDELGLSDANVPKTPTGSPSTKREVLEELYISHRHPVLSDMISHSKLSHMESTYGSGILKWCDSKGYVHPTFKVGGTVTGRVTATEPPLTTIPRARDFKVLDRDVELRFRHCFVSAPGWEITYADLVQAELYVLAIVSGEEKMLAAFRKGLDIHDRVARDIFKIPKGEEVPKECRVRAKNINFGIMYGGSAAGIAASIGANTQEVQSILNDYFVTYPTLSRFLDGVAMLAVSEGKLEGVFGRVRRFPGVDPDNPREVARVGREAKNYHSQNGAAEALFRAVNRICDCFRKRKMTAWPINLVYDAVLVHHPKKEREAVREIMVEEITRPIPELGNNRFRVEVGTDRSWGLAEENAEKITA